MRLWITGESGATGDRYLCSATSVELKLTMVEMAFLLVRPLRSGVLGPSDHCTCKHVDDYDTRTMLHVLPWVCTAPV